MGEAAATERKPRPPTLRQERLVETVKTAKTKRQALIEAGYSKTTAYKTPGQALSSTGYVSALTQRESKRLDSARGLAGISAKAAAYADQDIKELDPRTRLGVVIEAAKAAAALGEDVQQRGHGQSAKDKRARCCRLYKRLILRALERQGLIRSDYVNSLVPPSSNADSTVIDVDVVADAPGEPLL